MNGELTLFHGSRMIIKRPEFGKGNRSNDYGLGFYCTESLELAKEWACTEENNGFANAYRFDSTGLDILDLSGEKFSILNWLAVLLENRTFKISNEIALEGKEYLLDKFLPDYRNADVIVGYRADDSYFSFANAFLNNTLSLAQLEKAMYLGKLGEQVVLKSRKAIGRISFVEAVAAEREIYYPKKAARDSEARTSYRTERGGPRASEAIYLLDILRGEWSNDDPRLRRKLS